MNEVSQTTDRVQLDWQRWWALAAPLLLALGCTLVCLWGAGNGLGLFFGGVVVGTLLTPPLTLAQRGWTKKTMAGGAVGVGIAVIWLLAVTGGVVRLDEWLAAAVVLAAYLAALAALAAALHGLGLAAVAAAGVTIILALAWLSWPIWLTVWLTGEHRQVIVALLVAPHPLLSINSALSQSLPVPWGQYRLAYSITSIGQHIPYEMPSSIWQAVLVHGVLVVVLAAGGQVRAAWRGWHKGTTNRPA